MGSGVNKSPLRCFGHYGRPQRNRICSDCEYCIACQMWQQTCGKDERSHDTVSFDAIEDEFMLDFDQQVMFNPWDDRTLCQELKNHRRCFYNILGKFLQWLASLSPAQLELLQATFSAYKDGGTERVGTPDIAKKLGCSRQRVHTRIIKFIASKPETFIFFREVLFKLEQAQKLKYNREAIQAQQKFLKRRSPAKAKAKTNDRT